MKIFAGWGLLPLLFIASVVQADAPLRPPHRHSECSSSGEFCVTSDPAEGTFVHDADVGDAEAAPWHIPEWFRTFWVLDDGEHLITGYNGLNLVPQNEPAATTVVRFWRRGEPLRSYTLEDLGYQREDLQKTVSHYHWGSYGGLNSSGGFELTMVDGRTFIFDPMTGDVVKRSRRAV